MRLFDLEHAATTDDWYTPPWIFAQMGVTFDLDVCTPPGGVPWIPTRHYYTENDDGLAQDWYGIVWCNPPYSAPTRWCYKWVEHGNGVLVLRADLSLKGQREAFAAATSLLVPIGRLQFVNGHGETEGAVNFSTILLGIGEGSQALANIQDGVHRWLHA